VVHVFAETPRLVLRRFTMADVDDVMRFVTGGLATTREEQAGSTHGPLVSRLPCRLPDLPTAGPTLPSDEGSPRARRVSDPKGSRRAPGRPQPERPGALDDQPSGASARSLPRRGGRRPMRTGGVPVPLS
jgi:hypothetical protein